MVKLFYVANSVINNVVYEKIIRLFVMQNIRTSREILSLMLISWEMSLNCTEMAYINNIVNDINDKVSFLRISSA